MARLNATLCASVICYLAVATGVAKAASPKIESMIPLDGIPTFHAPGSPIFHSIAIGEIIGETRKPDPLDLRGPQLDKEDFREVLRKTFDQNGLLSVSDQAAFQLKTHIVGAVSTDERVLGSVGYSVIRYKLVRSSDGNVVFDEVVMRKKETHSFFATASRQKVLDASVRDNVAGLLTDLQTLASSGVLALDGAKQAPLESGLECVYLDARSVDEINSPAELSLGRQKVSPYLHGITIDKVDLGATVKRDELGLIGPGPVVEDFRQLLRDELDRAGLLSDSQAGTYHLNVKILGGTSFRKPGLSYTGYAVVRYSVVPANGNDAGFCAVLERESSATLSDAFAGAVRSRKAMEAAVQSNVAGVLKLLQVGYAPTRADGR